MTDDNADRPLDDAPAASAQDTTGDDPQYVEHQGDVPVTQADVDAAGIVPRAEDSEEGEPLGAGALDEIGTVSIDGDEAASPAESPEETLARLEAAPAAAEGAADERVEAETPAAPKQPTPGKPMFFDEDEEAKGAPAEGEKDWYIVKCAVNRETSIKEALQRKIRLEKMEEWIDDVLIPIEEQIEFTKAGKRRTVKKKLYPGYLVVHMAITDETRLLVRDTPGIVDFTGAVGKPTPLGAEEVSRILAKARPPKKEEGAAPEEVFVNIKFKEGDKVRVNEGNFQNFEGEVSGLDRSNGNVTVMITIFGRSTPVELKHWQVESM
ncbi:MAG TPA: transcription termination/antitermination protein NusG [Pirellulaceae bacterium]|jgi:transcriptional antiterminator NusG|nr:transcription termination/antitermination protein NusG [Pirellulaceae bacterium]